MNNDEILAQLRWCFSSVRLIDVSGDLAIEADGVQLSFNEAESLARGDTSLSDIASARKAMQEEALAESMRSIQRTASSTLGPPLTIALVPGSTNSIARSLLRLILAAEWLPPPLRPGHPFRRSPTTLATTTSQAFQHEDRFLDLLSFGAELGQHLEDVHC